MRVIVKESGFYAGNWHEASSVPVTMPDKVARLYLPPFGNQLEIAAETVASKRVEKSPVSKQAD